VRLLQQGELDHALVGAVDLAGDVRSVLATHAHRGFSAAEATVIGEGAAAVILKRQADAERDGDRIYAILQADAFDAHSHVRVESPTLTGLGDSGAASALAGIVQASLCLFQQILPTGPQFWLRDRASGPRRAVVESRNVAR